MLVTASGFSALIQALGLTQGFSKPNPSFGLSASDNPSLPLVPNPVQLGVNDLQAALGDSSCNGYPYDVPSPGYQPPPPFDQAEANMYRYRQQQSVNLGSWFTHEQWMTPSIFKCAAGSQISELDIASGWGSTESARAVLERHWDTFINQSDFEYLAGIGINTVRLPIGYWSLGPDFCKDTPFDSVADVYQNSWNRVLRAINMAGEAGIGVLVDLHGAVGSQNGQPHSGISDGAVNLFSDESNIEKTIDVLNYLTQQLAYITNVVGIQILNEPQNVPGLRDFYSRAIASMRQMSPAAASLPLYVHDGFDLELFSEYVASRPDFVVQDHHSYFVFTDSDDAEPASQHIKDIDGPISTSLANSSAQERHNLVVDEWSCALTDQSMANEADQNTTRQNFCTGQMEVYANVTAGWSFWSYRKEECVDDLGWCFTAAVGNSLPSTFFSYGQGQITDPAQLQSLASVVANMALPPNVLANSFNSTVPPLSRRLTSESRRLSRYRHRLVSIHLRQAQDQSGQIDTTDAQRSATKGYSDGFLTAKIFATYNMSKLGFIGQYIQDSLTALGSTVIATGTEQNYTDSFRQGLQDGQAIIFSAINPVN